MDLESPRAQEEGQHDQPRSGVTSPISYRDTLQRNNPNLTCETRDNPMWLDDIHDIESDNDEPVENEDPLCPTIILTAAEKKALREPWRNALIIRMFDKGIGYLQLKRRLKAKWALRGDFSLIDIGCDYYVTRFTNMEDYDHVMTNGPWMIGDNYLVIREWVPNFVPEEDKITKLTAWVRIPRISVEYFNKQFLLYKIGQKIGRVLKIDSTTESVARGQYTRMCIEVDLTKPLLSKFRLNGRVWGIQYEGLKMICFQCGRQGHKEEACTLNKDNPMAEEPHHTIQHPAKESPVVQTANYGSWMLVKKPARRNNGRQQPQRVRTAGPAQGEPDQIRARYEPNRTELNMESAPSMETNQSHPQSRQENTRGSRFSALAELDLNMDVANQETESEAHKETNPIIVANSSLVREKQVAFQDPHLNQDGSRISRDKENFPLRRQVESNTIDWSAATRVIPNSGPIILRPPPAQLGSHRPTSLNPPRIRRNQPIVESTSARRPQLDSNSTDEGPIITDLDAPPGNLLGREEFIRTEQPSEAIIRTQGLDNQPRPPHVNMEMDS